MSEERPEYGVTAEPAEPAEPGEGAQALVALQALIADVDLGRHPDFRPQPVAQALTALARTSTDEVPVAARLAVLHRMLSPESKVDIPDPEFRAVAQSVVEGRGVDSAQLLDAVKASAVQGLPLRKTVDGLGLAHHEVAFIGEGEEVCDTRTVTVGGRTATWIYSEFETDADFAHVKEWIQPKNWPAKGPLLFKAMTDMGSSTFPKPDPLGGTEHWHGVYREEVQLLRRLTTLLHCDVWADGDRAAGMTYDLDLSVGNDIDVDRGYLAVERVGGKRLRVRALKIVSFTQDIWDGFAKLVCPFWTDWVRQAVEGGTDSRPTGKGDDTAGTSAQTPLGRNLAAWVDFWADSARGYVDLAADVNAKALSGGYTQGDWLGDGTRYWSRLAKDWAKAWKYGIEALDELAEQGLDAGLTPPGTPRGTARGGASAFAAATAAAGAAAAGTPGPGFEWVDVPLPDPAPAGQVVCPGLRPLGDKGAPIPAERISVTVANSSGANSSGADNSGADSDGHPVARVAIADRAAAHGLYVGELRDSAGTRLAPVQLYLSRASEARGR